jgi:hypothetical protein
MSNMTRKRVRRRGASSTVPVADSPTTTAVADTADVDVTDADVADAEAKDAEPADDLPASDNLHAREMHPPQRRTKPRLSTYSSNLTHYEIETSRQLATNPTIACVVRVRIYTDITLNAAAYALDCNLLRTTQSVDENGSFAVRKADMVAQLKSYDPNIDTVRLVRSVADETESIHSGRMWLGVKDAVDYILVHSYDSSDMCVADVIVGFISKSVPEPQSASSTTSVSSSTTIALKTVEPRNLS